MTIAFYDSCFRKASSQKCIGRDIDCQKAGLTNEQIMDSLKNVSLTDMRMQVIPAKNGSLFINDAYNAAPTSMSAAITFIRETTIRPEKWLVLGDMLELGD